MARREETMATTPCAHRRRPRIAKHRRLCFVPLFLTPNFDHSEGDKEHRMGREWKQAYELTASLVTTAYNMSMEFTLKDCSPCTNFVGNATGIFTAAASPLQEAKLFTDDLATLYAKGRYFYFNPSVTCFTILFYDEQHNLLGEVRASPPPCAANPGIGQGNWSQC